MSKRIDFDSLVAKVIQQQGLSAIRVVRRYTPLAFLRS